MTQEKKRDCRCRRGLRIRELESALADAIREADERVAAERAAGASPGAAAADAEERTPGERRLAEIAAAERALGSGEPDAARRLLAAPAHAEASAAELALCAGRSGALRGQA